MGFDTKSRGRQGVKVSGAPVSVVHAAAPPALEMMMMAKTRGFVARRLAGQLDQTDLCSFGHQLEVAVDRREAERGDFAPREVQNFLG